MPFEEVGWKGEAFLSGCFVECGQGVPALWADLQEGEEGDSDGSVEAAIF